MNKATSTRTNTNVLEGIIRRNAYSTQRKFLFPILPTKKVNLKRRCVFGGKRTVGRLPHCLRVGQVYGQNGLHPGRFNRTAYYAGLYGEQGRVTKRMVITWF